jgi:hypothetical protein
VETEQERKMNWTDQKVNKLKGLWEQGIIAAEIAKIFGTSKNSIIGKANRLKCIPRKQGGTRRKRSQNIFKETPKITEPENPTLLTSLTNNQCKFPLWKNSNEPQLFCGRKHQNKFSYCNVCYDKTHIKIKPQMKERRV